VKSRVVLDQGLPYSTTRHLNQCGWDAVHVVDLEMSRATDREIIHYALKEKRICITLDSDFHTILAVNRMRSPSVVRIRQEGLNGFDMANLIKRVWTQISSQLEQGALATVTEDTVRIRKLPV
jgi:predicted nuclease of predicted toxin-antitoxin system